jgi:hypothetical protein
MSRSSLGMTLGLALLLMLSRKERSTEYCAGDPDDADCRASGEGRLFPCVTDEQCAHVTPVCDGARSMCVPRIAVIGWTGEP